MKHPSDITFTDTGYVLTHWLVGLKHSLITRGGYEIVGMIRAFRLSLKLLLMSLGQRVMHRKCRA